VDRRVRTLHSANILATTAPIKVSIKHGYFHSEHCALTPPPRTCARLLRASSSVPTARSDRQINATLNASPARGAPSLFSCMGCNCNNLPYVRKRTDQTQEAGLFSSKGQRL
jgi:hypothetical protein